MPRTRPRCECVLCHSSLLCPPLTRRCRSRKYISPPSSPSPWCCPASCCPSSAWLRLAPAWRCGAGRGLGQTGDQCAAQRRYSAHSGVTSPIPVTTPPPRPACHHPTTPGLHTPGHVSTLQADQARRDTASNSPLWQMGPTGRQPIHTGQNWYFHPLSTRQCCSSLHSRADCSKG